MNNPEKRLTQSIESTLNEDLFSDREEWIARPETPIDRDFFQLQFEVAKRIAETNDTPLVESIVHHTSFLDSAVFEKKNHNGDQVIVGFSPGYTAHDVVPMAYDQYMETMVSKEPIPYRNTTGHRFGCFHYSDWHSDDGVISVHFNNFESDSLGPLHHTRLGMRRREMKDMLSAIYEKYPAIQTLTGCSWIYSVPAYRDLFAASYRANLTERLVDGDLTEGLRLWGQFLNSEQKVRDDRRDALLRGVYALPRGVSLLHVFAQEGTTLSPVYETRGPLRDMYIRYGVIEQ